MLPTDRDTDLTAERLRALLTYEPATGVFRWLAPTSHKVKLGDLASHPHTSGHNRIKIGARNYYAARVAWLYMTGEWPAARVDHENLDKADDRWSNLRAATMQQNAANRPAHKGSHSGLKGAFWHKTRRRWTSAIRVDDRLIHLGRFPTAETAHAAYVAAAEHHFGPFARAA